MDVKSAVMEPRSSWGAISISEDDNGRLYTWSPSERLLGCLPAGFQFALRCVDLNEGKRIFWPTGDIPGFVVQAAMAGHAILQQGADWDEEASFSYGLMRLLYQLSPRLRSNLKRSIRRSDDLYIATKGRVSESNNILPDDLGVAADCEERWTVSRLMEEGRRAAKQAGDLKPTPERRIWLGLGEAAKRNPVDLAHLSEEDALQWVRLSLFDLGPATHQITDDVKARVEERLIDAIEKHIDAETDEFHRWLFYSFDNLTRQISKRKSGGGPIDRKIVRQVLLEGVFSSYRYMSDCVHVAMRAFAQALASNLTDDERMLFEVIYRRQPCLGNLSLLLLHDRFMHARECILEIWRDPSDADRWGTLLRLLRFHAEMITKKRESERVYQQRHADDKVGEIECHDAYIDEFQLVAVWFRQRHGLTCQCGSTDSWQAECEDATLDIELIRWTDGCRACGHTEEVCMPKAKFMDVADEVLASLH